MATLHQNKSKPLAILRSKSEHIIIQRDLKKEWAHFNITALDGTIIFLVAWPFGTGLCRWWTPMMLRKWNAFDILDIFQYVRGPNGIEAAPRQRRKGKAQPSISNSQEGPPTGLKSKNIVYFLYGVLAKMSENNQGILHSVIDCWFLGLFKVQPKCLRE